MKTQRGAQTGRKQLAVETRTGKEIRIYNPSKELYYFLEAICQKEGISQSGAAGRILQNHMKKHQSK